MDKIDEYFKKAMLTKKGTTTVFRSHIKKYFKIINKDMETYFDKKQPYEEHIRDYWNYLQDKAPKTRAVAISSIKLFLKCFDKKGTMNLDIWDTIYSRMKRNTDPICEEHVPDLDEIKQILHYCDIRTKATIIVALSSGMRISEVIKLLPGDIYLNETPTRINVRAEISKNGKRRTTFISSEATEILKEWLRVKDSYIKNSMKSFNFKSMQDVKNKDNKEIFPFHANRIRESFNRACDKAGFTGKTKMNGDFDHKYKRSRRKLHYHNLRKFFRTYFGNSDLAEHLMGHTGYLSTYRQFNDKQLAQEYLKHVENVIVFERSPDLTETNERIRKLEKEKEEKDKQIKELQDKMGKMEFLIDQKIHLLKLLELQVEQEKIKNQINKNK